MIDELKAAGGIPLFPGEQATGKAGTGLLSLHNSPGRPLVALPHLPMGGLGGGETVEWWVECSM